ncbi:MAG: ParB/RepB/Spo0J family partition protein [Nitrospirales bacterium]|nr:ParB/RepB/Spo0J family partition protein [Nitrospirales bacterium]
MKQEQRKANPKAQEKKSKHLEALENTFHTSTRRFSAFTELGIPPDPASPPAPVVDEATTHPAPQPQAVEQSPRPALVPQMPTSVSSVGEPLLLDIPVSQVVPNPNQPRFLENPDANERLQQSIQTSGMIQPILVRPLEDERYEIIAGERRWRACQTLGMESIPAIIRSVDPRHSATEALIENLVREDLSPIEEATAYQRLLHDHGFTQMQIADRTGISQSRISQLLKLLSLPEDLRQQLFAPGSAVSSSHGEILATLNHDPQRQRELAQRLLKEQWTRDELQRQINREPRVNKGFQAVQFTDRGEKGYHLVVCFHSNRPQDLEEVESKLQEALDRVKSVRALRT